MFTFMARSGLPHSLRKFLRREKAFIRRQTQSSPEAESKIRELVEAVAKKTKQKKVDGPR